MKINPTYVTFKQAKILKEKGFDELTKVWRQHGNGISRDVIGKQDYYNRKGDVYTSLPEQWQVIEWLRINHGIWIELKSPDMINTGYYFTIHKPFKFGNFYNEDTLYFNSPQEAYSEAFDYVLDNLI